jgi:hypothetical protein
LVNVADVLTDRFGFRRTGRFAGSCRTAFGKTPSTTPNVLEARFAVPRKFSNFCIVSKKIDGQTSDGQKSASSGAVLMIPARRVLGWSRQTEKGRIDPRPLIAGRTFRRWCRRALLVHLMQDNEAG